MSRQKARAQQTGLIQFPGLVHFIVVLIISAIEVIGLVIWLQLESGMSLSVVLVPLTSLSQLESLAGRTGFAGIVLGMFLLVEHIITQVDQTGRLSGGAFLEIFAFSILEVIIWVVWLALIPINGILALAFFLATLFVEHQIADNVKKGLAFLHFASPSSRVFLGLVIFTIAEVVGAGAWVSMSSIIALAVGSIIEHYIARNVGQIRE